MFYCHGSKGVFVICLIKTLCRLASLKGVMQLECIKVKCDTKHIWEIKKTLI